MSTAQATPATPLGSKDASPPVLKTSNASCRSLAANDYESLSALYGEPALDAIPAERGAVAEAARHRARSNSTAAPEVRSPRGVRGPDSDDGGRVRLPSPRPHGRDLRAKLGLHPSAFLRAGVSRIDKDVAHASARARRPAGTMAARAWLRDALVELARRAVRERCTFSACRRAS